MYEKLKDLEDNLPLKNQISLFYCHSAIKYYYDREKV